MAFLTWAESHPLVVLVGLWLLTSLVVAVTPERYRRARWYGWLLSVADRLSVLTHSDSPGTLKLPGIASAIDPRGPLVVEAVKVAADRSRPGFASPRSMALGLLIALGLLVLAPIVGLMHGCAGTHTTVGATSTVQTSPGGDLSWTVGLSVGVTVASAALPVAQAAADSLVPPQARADVDRGFTIARDALPLVSTALDAYTSAPSVPAKCRVRAELDHVIDGALQGLTLARDAGAPAAALAPAQASVGGLAAIADVLWPSCASSSGPATQRHVSTLERVAHAFGAP